MNNENNTNPNNESNLDETYTPTSSTSNTEMEESQQHKMASTQDRQSNCQQDVNNEKATWTSSNPQVEAESAQQNTNSQEPHQQKRKKKGELTPSQEIHKLKKSMVKTMITCALVSGVVGFGGGVFALNNTRNSTTLYQSNGSKVNVQTVAAGNEMDVQQIAALNQASVVEIRTEQLTTGSFLQQSIQTGAGSGVILTDEGYIVTNNHVIDGAQSIKVSLSNGQSYDAELIGTDSQTDIAIIKIDVTGLPFATLGDSDTINVGDSAVAIGNPLGELGGTVTNGIISALDRELTIDGQKMNLLQTNAAINPGNSGGGLFNSRGELIGIVNAKSSGSDVEGLGFAIPINDVKSVAEELITNGYVTGRPALGVSIVEVNSAQLAMQYGVNSLGVYIASIEENSAAAKAGLQSGDYVISVDDQAIESMADLTSVLKDHQVGDTIVMMVKRNNQTVSVSITLQEKKTTPETTPTQSQSNRNYPLG